MKIQKINKDDYKLHCAGVTGLEWEDTNLAEKLQPEPNITKHKFLFWRWETSKIDTKKWLNDCIIHLLNYQNNESYIYRIIDRIYDWTSGGEFGPRRCFKGVYCIWENGRKTWDRI